MNTIVCACASGIVYQSSGKFGSQSKLKSPAKAAARSKRVVDLDAASRHCPGTYSVASLVFSLVLAELLFQ